MKKLFIAAFVSLVVSSFAFASEEIQLAAAIGAGASTTAPEPVADTGVAATNAGTEAGSAASSAAALGTGSKVAIGVLAAGAIAALASSGGGSSTANH